MTLRPSAIDPEGDVDAQVAASLGVARADQVGGEHAARRPAAAEPRARFHGA